MSLKIVGQGVAAEQGAGVVTFVITSEISVPLDPAADAPPRDAVI
jgi:hypothetical protein